MKNFSPYPITTILLIANIVSYIVQLLMPAYTNLFILNSSLLLMQPWRLVTHMFLHGSPTHLLFNMLGLFFFGYLVENKIGQVRFTLLYFISGIIAGFMGSFFFERALGASGALMGIIGFVILTFPKLQVLFFGIIPMPMWVAGIIFFLYDFFGAIASVGNVGHEAHIAGLLVGLVYAYYYRVQEKKETKRVRVNKEEIEVMDASEYMKQFR